MGGRSKTRFVGATTGMIERKAFLQITKALILGMRNSLADPFACIKQNIIEELAAVLGMERCVIFKVGQEEVDGTSRAFCEIAAGVPPEEYGPDFRERSPLGAHPDIEAAVQNGRVLVIKHPLRDERTAYFRGIIEAKDVSEIAYIPLFIEEDSPPAGVIVFDAVHGRSFSQDEIAFCSEVAELLDLLLGQERIMLQNFRDAIINKVVPLGGFARRLQENLRTTLDYIEIIRKEATEIDCIIPKTLNGGLQKKGSGA
ncbi:MAG: GAF domain-containing protein [Syntrophorhabdales bacterium]|jgi:GAF domain-containing protein